MPDPTTSIEEIYFGKLLPEAAVGMPYWSSLSQEQRDYYTSSNNPNDPIRRAIDMQAREGYGIGDNPTFSQSVQDAVTEIPGAIGENMLIEPLGALQSGAVELAKEIVPGGKRGDIRNVLPGLTSTITGDPTARQELPSEYIGFQNPGGFFDSPTAFGKNIANMGIDAVTDPVDLIGGGMLLDGLKLLPKGLKSIDDIVALGAKKGKKYMSFEEFDNVMQTLKNAGVNTEGIEIIEESKRFSKDMPEFNKILFADEFFTDLGKDLSLIKSRIDNKIKLLESPEGFSRQLKIEEDYLRSIGVPEDEIRITGPMNVKARIEELKTLKINNEKLADLSKNPDKYYSPEKGLSAEAVGILENDYLYNNAYYRQPALVEMLDPYDPVLQNISSGAFNLTRGTQYGRVPVTGGKISFSRLYKNNPSVIDHELAHALQRGRKLPLDNEIKQLTLRSNLKKGTPEFEAAKYFKRGSKGKEPSAFLAELKTTMIEKGLIKNEHSFVTPERMKIAYQYFLKNPQGVASKSEKGMKILSNTRILDIIEPSKDNFELLAKLMNKTNVLLPGAVGASLVGNQTLKKEPEQFQEGGEVIGTDPEDPFANALQSRQPYRDDYMNKLLKYAEPGDDTYMRIEDAFADKFNTELTPIEKIHYKLWLEAGFGNPRDIGVYDIQGYWKSGQWKNNTDPDNHGTDEFKKPNHPTFSAESKYSKQKGGSEYIGGVWREDGGFMAGPHNFYDNEALMWEFNREPNRPEYLYMGLPAVTVNENKKPAVLQNTPSFDDGGEVTDKNDPEKTEKKKAVILAETPNKYYTVYTRDKTLPEELQSLQEEYRLVEESKQRAQEKERTNEKLFHSYLKGYLGEDFDERELYTPYSEYKIHPEVRNSSQFLDYKTAYDKNLAYTKKLNYLDREFQKKIKEQEIKDTTFLEEADRMKSWYEKNNQPYEIYPVYGDTNEIKKILAKEDIGDLVLMGHSGAKLAGVPLKDWNRYLQDSNYEQCILGSCHGDWLIEHGLGNVRDMSHTTETPWVGVNPRAETKEDFYFPNTSYVYNP